MYIDFSPPTLNLFLRHYVYVYVYVYEYVCVHLYPIIYIWKDIPSEHLYAHFHSKIHLFQEDNEHDFFSVVYFLCKFLNKSLHWEKDLVTIRVHLYPELF